MAVVPIVVGLVGNLATDTVSVDRPWWPWATWTAVAVLVVAAVLVERARSRPGTTTPVAPPPGVPAAAPLVGGNNTGIVSTGDNATNTQNGHP